MMASLLTKILMTSSNSFLLHLIQMAALKISSNLDSIIKIVTNQSHLVDRLEDNLILEDRLRKLQAIIR